jgi:hypothetical protein
MSKHFPKTHPAAGEETHFIQSILNGSKTTTIRGKYENWKKKAREVNEGKAVISIRYWTGSPYNSKNDDSKQKEFAKCTKLSTYRVFITNDHNGFEMSVGGKYCDMFREEEIINEEGFTIDSHFYDWFPQEEFSGIMLGFLEIEKAS